MSERKTYVIQRIHLSNAKEFCSYIFGGFYMEAYINRHENIIEILVKSKLNVKQKDGSFKEASINEYVDMNHFSEHWKGRIKVLIFDQLQTNRNTRKQ